MLSGFANMSLNSDGFIRAGWLFYGTAADCGHRPDCGGVLLATPEAPLAVSRCSGLPPEALVVVNLR